eukprot:5896585-Amphidinium_carterae.1
MTSQTNYLDVCERNPVPLCAFCTFSKLLGAQTVFAANLPVIRPAITVPTTTDEYNYIIVLLIDQPRLKYSTWATATDPSRQYATQKTKSGVPLRPDDKENSSQKATHWAQKYLTRPNNLSQQPKLANTKALSSPPFYMHIL